MPCSVHGSGALHGGCALGSYLQELGTCLAPWAAVPIQLTVRRAELGGSLLPFSSDPSASAGGEIIPFPGRSSTKEHHFCRPQLSSQEKEGEVFNSSPSRPVITGASDFLRFLQGEHKGH